MTLPEEKQDRAFLAHVRDLFAIAQGKYVSRFTGFLDLHEAALARQAATGEGGNYAFFAGHPQGERVMLGVFPPYEEPDENVFPIVPITITFREKDELGHRDLLGSLTGLELKREALGDILVEPGLAVCFVTEAAASVILNELDKVGRCGVQVSRGLPPRLPALHHYEDLDVNVPSLRLDCIVAAAVGISREKSAQSIRAKLVSVNGAPASDGSDPLREGDIVSIRGFGKFLFAGVRSTTKKGRLQILCRKYV